ncbi:MAG: tRNA (N(6)-L-threonylcarbamoyladenosine(37)-C(2))-methylthiotransferase MtaB [Finegoldia sp.]|nr:tRNA (N(6)-L-threonylcarbamoyladenosine(37)-C(2))-methylthiotransferase MtaB [Finegoldia sp.]
MNKKVKFLTLGCKVNQYESEAMKELFLARGYDLTDEDNCDIFVINTCTVTNLSDRKARQYISKVKRNNHDAVIAVVGCYAQVNADQIEKIDGVNIILGTQNKNKIVDLCEEYENTQQNINIVRDFERLEDYEEMKTSQEQDMTRAYIKIQDGCNQYCSYCIIPYARGPIRSRNIEDVEKEALKLADQGYKEVVLTGIHVASYGKDFKDLEISLADVIEKIASIDKIERIRMSSLEPSIISDDFLLRLKNTGKICDHFHLSLQSGSDKILKLMNRKYDTKMYFDKVELIRKYFPNAGITTDIIVGFPNESEEDFLDTLDFVKKVAFSKIHVFRYSRREGTKAYDMSGQIDGNTKKKRSSRLIDCAKEMTDEFLDKNLSYNHDVLFESKNDDGYMYGYTTNYIRVKKKYDPDLVNQIVNLKLDKRENEELISL